MPHPKIKELEYDYIADGIYIGSNQCCQTHFDAELIKKGIEADISLEEDRVDAPFGIKFYLWLPVKKGMAPSNEQFILAVSVLEKLIAMKKKVYIHCQNGHGRTSSLVAAYLMNRGKTLQQAIEFIRTRRPTAHFGERQIKELEKFSATLLLYDYNLEGKTKGVSANKAIRAKGLE